MNREWAGLQSEAVSDYNNLCRVQLPLSLFVVCSTLIETRLAAAK